ncbi:MAG: hypothetical protein WD872_13850 [Pirellulaceae bacterium]
MVYGRVRCQVVETPAHADRLPHADEWPRDLLPWADPYIATLMMQLERRYEWSGESDAGNPLPDEPRIAIAYDDSWQDDDAFMPGRLEGRRRPMFPPIYGGFPLLDDVTDGLDEDSV